MNANELFKVQNLIFVSKTDVIGSLYFRSVDAAGQVYRGRIRLCHEDGPRLSIRDDPETRWKLGNEIWYDESRTGKKPKSQKSYGNLISGTDFLPGIVGKRIFEDYTNGRHSSRGVLVLPAGLGIAQAHVDLLRAGILESYPSVDAANEAIIALTNRPDMPASLRQVAGKYGC